MTHEEFTKMLKENLEHITLNNQEAPPTDFYINQRPVSISLTCPYCHSDIEVDWGDVDVPDCWSDDWGTIECPECEEYIELGDYDIG